MSGFAQSVLGFFCLHLIAWCLSENRRAVAWRTVVPGMVLTVLLAFASFRLPFLVHAFAALNDMVGALERATQAGTGFVFGYLGGAPLPFEEKQPGASFILAFRALPMVLVIGALSSLFHYWGILALLVRAFSWVLERVLGLGGAVGLAAAANILLGMVEAPLFVRPYVAAMSRSELFIMMTCGMAMIAGTVMVLYASILSPIIPEAMGNILIASVVATPAAIVVSVLMIPPDRVRTPVDHDLPQPAHSTMDAITRGTAEGMALLINITAMLIVLVALVHLADLVIGLLPNVGGTSLTLERLFGWVMAPLVWLAGIPWPEAPAAGALMGSKTVLNEFIAYMNLAQLAPGVLSPRSRLIMLYALCGFANFGSLGIMVGGISAMAPQRRADIVGMAGRTLVSGTLATLISASVVGMLT
jgi:CNT family concentrative nucleoside transporter